MIFDDICNEMRRIRHKAVIANMPAPEFVVYIDWPTFDKIKVETPYMPIPLNYDEQTIMGYPYYLVDPKNNHGWKVYTRS